MISAAQPSQNNQDESPASSGPGGRSGAAINDPQFWTQAQQRLLEKALLQFPRGSADRWDRVAELIPGKTKVITITTIYNWRHNAVMWLGGRRMVDIQIK